MPFGSSPWLAAAVVLIAGVGGAVAWRKWRRPLTPEERERRRRLRVEAQGRVTDGVLVEVRGHVVYYRYHVGGTEYVASQDLSPLLDRLPADLAGLSGHASVKYLPDNPANSIVVSENWCGLHRRLEGPRRPGWHRSALP
ncbi:MAG: hypothetical protein RMI94_00310 [Bryobacterales bacterium]|nr:hypothetical protein [Bryobacteraceae bacterium]MDW8128962.1 hypothetical protein [Bryobacterales bacterium]